MIVQYAVVLVDYFIEKSYNIIRNPEEAKHEIINIYDQ